MPNRWKAGDRADDGEVAARVAALVERAQNAVYNGQQESDRVAAEVTEQLVAMIDRTDPKD